MGVGNAAVPKSHGGGGRPAIWPHSPSLGFGRVWVPLAEPEFVVLVAILARIRALWGRIRRPPHASPFGLLASIFRPLASTSNQDPLYQGRLEAKRATAHHRIPACSSGLSSEEPPEPMGLQQPAGSLQPMVSPECCRSPWGRRGAWDRRSPWGHEVYGISADVATACGATSADGIAAVRVITTARRVAGIRGPQPMTLVNLGHRFAVACV